MRTDGPEDGSSINGRKANEPGVLLMDTKGRLLFVNDPILEIVDRTRKDLIGSSIYDLVGSTDLAGIKNALDPEIEHPLEMPIGLSSGGGDIVSFRACFDLMLLGDVTHVLCTLHEKGRPAREN